jgi:hypothetical protein
MNSAVCHVRTLQCLPCTETSVHGGEHFADRTPFLTESTTKCHDGRSGRLADRRSSKGRAARRNHRSETSLRRSSFRKTGWTTGSRRCLEGLEERRHTSRVEARSARKESASPGQYRPRPHPAWERLQSAYRARGLGLCVNLRPGRDPVLLIERFATPALQWFRLIDQMI